MAPSKEELEHETRLLQQITQASDAIRQKYQLIKSGRANADRTFSEIFKPVTNRLKQLVEKNIKPKKELKDDDFGDGGTEKQDLLRQTRDTLRKKDLDTTWGVREVQGRLMIGDSPLQTHGDQLVVENNTYTLTPGLLDLLLKKGPGFKPYLTP